MKIVLVWREEAQKPRWIYAGDPTDPFDGIEVYQILSDDRSETDEQLHDRLQKLADEHGGKWKFHIETPPLKG